MDNALVFEESQVDKYLEVNSTRLHYLDYGGGGEILLFLSGLGDSAYSFSGLAPKFKSDFRVLSLTRRGFGKSEMPDGPYDIYQLINDIKVFLDLLGISRASIVGHSIAGNEMTLFASTYPDKVERLIYIEAAYDRNKELREISKNDPIRTLASGKTPESAFASLEDYINNYRMQHPGLNRIWSPITEMLCKERIRIRDDGTVEEIDRKAIKAQIKKSIEQLSTCYSLVTSPILSFYALQEEHPYLPLVCPIEIRNLANQYNRDVWVPYTKRNIEKMRRENNNATIIELWNADHYCHLSDQEAVYSYMLEFLR